MNGTIVLPLTKAGVATIVSNCLPKIDKPAAAGIITIMRYLNVYFIYNLVLSKSPSSNNLLMVGNKTIPTEGNIKLA